MHSRDVLIFKRHLVLTDVVHVVGAYVAG